MENTQQNCIFCKIVAGLIPAEKIYEDTETLAFLDIKPVNKGHTLVIPKVHYQDTLDVPEELFMKMMATVKKIGHAFKDGLGVTNFNIGMNNGPAAGQVVFHAHIHVMPRHVGDGFELWKGTDYAPEEIQKIGSQLKNAL